MTNARKKLIDRLMDAVRSDDISDIRNALRALGNDVNVTDENGNTALHIAAEENCYDAAEYLLEQGIDRDITNDDDETASEVASNYHFTDIENLIDDYEAEEEDEPKADSQEDLISRLISAAQDGQLDDVKRLLPLIKAGIDAVDSDGDTALYSAAYYGQLHIIEYLLDNGADIDFKNNRGKTALHIAAEDGNGSEKIVALLLARGANPEATDNHGNKPRDLTDHTNTLNLLNEWSLLGSTKLVHIESSDVFGHKITEVFNFESRERITLVENLSRGSEINLPVTGFDDLNEPTLRTAFSKFVKLGGKADEGFVFSARGRLNKPSPLRDKNK